jgi:hypothetical protein
MGFLSGSMTFDCFRVDGEQPRQFGPGHVEALQQYAIGEAKSLSNEQARVGFLAGDHLLDYDFDLEKNVFGAALHFAVRIDTNQVPAGMQWVSLCCERDGRWIQSYVGNGSITSSSRCFRSSRSLGCGFGSTWLVFTVPSIQEANS